MTWWKPVLKMVKSFKAMHSTHAYKAQLFLSLLHQQARYLVKILLETFE